MLSKYFIKKVSNKRFDNYIKDLFEELKNKKILLYGAGEGSEYLFDNYSFKNLNIVAIADRKFTQETIFKGMKAISPDEITNQDYDVILITNEYTPPIVKYLEKDLKVEGKELKMVFEDLIPEERDSFMYLEMYNFEKHLKKMNKKLKNEKIVLYGSGVFFEVINEYYDLSELNIIGISDRRFVNHAQDERFLDYTMLAPEEIKGVNPDYVLVTTKFFINIIEDLYYNTLKRTKIKIKPLVKKPFITLINEIWK